MKLKLTLKGPDRLMGAQRETAMQGGSLVIGRAPTADWILPDPDRVVSKAHCRIDSDFSGFVLTDTSTNGIWVNEEAVGYGLPRLLADGDVLKLGDAVIVVRVEEAAAQPAATERPAGPMAQSAINAIPDGPFGPAEQALIPNDPDFFSSESVFSASPPRRAAEALPEEIRDDWWTSQEPFEPLGNPISVDISAKELKGAIPNTIPVLDPVPLQDGEMVKLAASLVGVDLLDLARAVDMAATALSESERHRFHGRLRDVLAGRHPAGTVRLP